MNTGRRRFRVPSAQTPAHMSAAGEVDRSLTYTTLLEMKRAGERPPGIRDIDDKPRGPPPPGYARSTSKLTVLKPWERKRAQQTQAKSTKVNVELQSEAKLALPDTGPGSGQAVYAHGIEKPEWMTKQIRPSAPALPTDLETAAQGLNSVSKADIVELKSFAAPPHAVKLVMEAVCILMGCAPTWAESKKLLDDGHFLWALKTFDTDNVSPARLRKLRKYVSMPQLHPDAVCKVSRAAHGLMRWVLAVAAFASIRTGVKIELASVPRPASAAPAPPKPHPKARPPRPKSAPVSRPRSEPVSRTLTRRPPWDDGMPKKPQPSPMPSQVRSMAWSDGGARNRDPVAASVKHTSSTQSNAQRNAQRNSTQSTASAASASSSARLLNAFGAVEHVAGQLEVLSRVVRDMNVRLGAVEQLL